MCVIYFTSQDVKWWCLHPSPWSHRIFDMPLSAASGAAGSGEANRKGLLDVWDCSSNLHCSPLSSLGCGISLPAQPHMWAERLAPQQNVFPRSWRLAEEFCSPPLTFLSQPILRNLGNFEIICRFIWFYNDAYVCGEVFCYSAEILSTLHFSHIFFITVQETNNALCFPAV